MEFWDVYDEFRNKTGRTHQRGQEMASGDYHLVVHIWIKNKKGEYLISKRTPNKTFPLMWECSGGSAIVGDDSLQAALREVKEEIGIDLTPSNGSIIYTTKKDDYFTDVWLFEEDININNVVYQVDEVCDAKYATKEQILKMIDDGIFIDHFTYLHLL